MNYRNILIYVIVAIAGIKAKDEEFNRSIFDNSSSLHLRRPGLTFVEKAVKKEKRSISQNQKRVLKVRTTQLFQTVSKAFEDDSCNDDDGENEDYDDDDDIITQAPGSTPTSQHTPLPTSFPTPDPEKKLLASDGTEEDDFGCSCSMSEDLFVIGACEVGNNEGAVYIFNLDGDELKKLTPEEDGEDDGYFGESVSIDQKVVVGSDSNYFRVFSLEGAYERTIRCDDCRDFGKAVVTLGDKIVTADEQNETIYIYNTDGELLKEIEHDSTWYNYDVAISDNVIVLTASRLYGTFHDSYIYSNSAPNFPIINQIEEGGDSVATAGDRIVFGNWWYDYARLYKTDGTFLKNLDHDSTSESRFGASVEITDGKILVGARADDLGGVNTGSVFIYSSDGEFIEKKVAPDAKNYDLFGSSVCASNSHYVVGARGVDDIGDSSGAAYLFQFAGYR